uniref:TetR family transcriptional regulator n=1 Tax=Nocardia carnea TaxID=37328 RepID=UPI0024566263
MTKGITRERIITAALELLDDQGMDAVTVRALASRLDVRAPALYWHVRDKQELLDEMATEVMRRVSSAFAAVPPGDGWRDDLTAYARVLRSEYLLHRDGARVFSGTRITDPNVVRMKEPLFERWAAAGWKPGAGGPRPPRGGPGGGGGGGAAGGRPPPAPPPGARGRGGGRAPPAPGFQPAVAQRSNNGSFMR